MCPIKHLVNAHQRVTSAEDDFNNQEIRMAHFFGYQSASFPSHPVITQWAHEQSGHGSKGGGYAWVHQHGLLFTKSYLAMATTKRPVFQQQRPTPSPQHDTIPWSDQSATCWQVDYMGPLPSWKRQHFALTGIYIYCEYEFAFPTRNPKLSSMDLQNVYLLLWYSTQHFF